MTTEDSALHVARQEADISGIDWRSNVREPDATQGERTTTAVPPDSPMASEAQPETSITQLSAVLIIILAGMASTFALGAILVLLAARG